MALEAFFVFLPVLVGSTMSHKVHSANSFHYSCIRAHSVKATGSQLHAKRHFGFKLVEMTAFEEIMLRDIMLQRLLFRSIFRMETMCLDGFGMVVLVETCQMLINLGNPKPGWIGSN